MNCCGSGGGARGVVASDGGPEGKLLRVGDGPAVGELEYGEGTLAKRCNPSKGVEGGDAYDIALPWPAAIGELHHAVSSSGFGCNGVQSVLCTSGLSSI